MFGKQIRLKRFFGGIVVLAAIAVAAAPSALASTGTRSGSSGPAPDALARYLVNHGAQAQQVQGYRFIATLPPGYVLGGNPHLVQAQAAQGYRVITDTLGGRRHLVQAQQPQSYNTNAYVPGGTTPSVAEEIQNSGWNDTAAPVVTGGSSGTGSDWRSIGIVAGAAVLLMLLLGGFRFRTGKPTVRPA